MNNSTAELNDRQRQFVDLYVYGPEAGNAAASYRAAGYAPDGSDHKAATLMAAPKIATAIAAAQAEKRAAIKARGITETQNRLDDLQRIRDGLEAVRAARAADPCIAKVPGGDSGFVVIQQRTVSAGRKKPRLVTESKVDAGLVTAWLNVLRQAAQELGQWETKVNLNVRAELEAYAIAQARQRGIDESEALAAVEEILREARIR